jgi:hypothetical protein
MDKQFSLDAFDYIINHMNILKVTKFIFEVVGKMIIFVAIWFISYYI